MSVERSLLGLPFKTVLIATWCLWATTVVCALVLAHRVVPDSAPNAEKLDAFVPTRFGVWQLAPDASATVVNPQVQANLDRYYDETVSRIYVNRTNGRQIMLSLAYGSNQSHATQLHKPEVCYPSQGFKIDSLERAEFHVAGREIPVTTLHASLGARSEYVSYWMVEGDSVVRGALQQNFHRALLALRGVVEGGLLYRVSEISTDERSSFALQREFSDALVSAVERPKQFRLIGSGTFSAIMGH
jgi:EpsI family protein